MQVLGTVYLICFDEPYRHARHYIGWTIDLEARLEAHFSGRGARLMEVITEAGIDWRVTRTWKNVSRSVERQKHNRHGSRLCPRCQTRIACTQRLPLF